MQPKYDNSEIPELDSYEKWDYIITPKTKRHLLSLMGEYFMAPGHGLCRIKSFGIREVKHNTGNMFFKKWEIITILSDIEIEVIHSSVDVTDIRHFDRETTQMHTVITHKLQEWISDVEKIGHEIQKFKILNNE